MTWRPPDNEAAAFHEFELAGWNRAASAYADRLAVMTAQAIPWMLDAVSAGAGVRLLDIASGPGRASAAAAERGAVPTGLDFAEGMVQQAASRYPTLTFRQGDAHELPFADTSFDAVICGFGLPHLAEPPRAVGEMRRVLRAGGALAMTYWESGPDATAFEFVREIVTQLGDPEVPVPRGLSYHEFGTPEPFAALLREAGFVDVSVQRLTLPWRLEEPDEVFVTLYDASVRNAAVLRAQSAPTLAKIRTALAERVGRHRAGSGYEIPMNALMARGVRPGI